MSTEIDNKVVSMSFDNSQFEKNVSQSMSTIDKLKQKLNFSEEANSLNEVEKAAEKTDLSPLEKAADAVSVKFSALEVIATTALVNITNSAINAGTNLVKSLSVDQLSSGWSKYEQKTANVQTLVNSTGKSINEINGYLEHLMWFSDETSYSFTDMTAALSQMTSSGGDIDNLIPLITGVANATAYAGKGASEFSRVMYNLNQSYGAGYLQLTDWKSVELAGVGSKQLKQILIDTGVAQGKIAEGEVTLANFSETLKNKWADTEVMETAFGKFSELSEAAYELVNDETSGYETAAEAIEALSGQYSEVGERAFKSAQEAKSFTEAIEATKDAVSSGWMTTFETIFGNYEEAKELWTGVTNWLWEVFAAGSKIRNKIVNSAFRKSIDEIANAFKKVETTATKVTSAVSSVESSLEDLDTIANKVIRGEFGSGATRIDKLTEAGYNYYKVQNKVNELLQNGARFSDEVVEAKDAELNATTEVTETVESESEAVSELSSEMKRTLKVAAAMSDEQLRMNGYDEERIENIRSLQSLADKFGMTFGDLLDNMDQINGRWLLIDSFATIGDSVLKSLNAIKDAWNEVFYGTTDEDTLTEKKAEIIFNLIAGFHKLTSYLEITDEKADKIKRTFEGLISVIKFILEIGNLGLALVKEFIGGILESLDMDFLDVTASIGDCLKKVTGLAGKLNFIKTPIKTAGKYLGILISKVKNFIDGFKESPIVVNAVEGVKNAFNAVMPKIQEWFSGLSPIFTDFIEDVKNMDEINLENIKGVFETLYNNLSTYMTGISDKFSTLTTSFTTLKDSVIGYFESNVDGFSDFKKNVTKTIDTVKKPISSFKTWIQNLDFDFGKLAAVSAVGGSILAIVSTVLKLVSDFDKVLGFINSIKSSFTGLFDSITGYFKSKKTEAISTMILSFAGSIFLLAASMLVLSKIPTEKLWEIFGVLAALMGLMAAIEILLIIVNKTGSASASVSSALSIVAFALAMVLIVKALTDFSKYPLYTYTGYIWVLVGIMAALAIAMMIINSTAKNATVGSALSIIAYALSMLILVKVLKKMEDLDPDRLLGSILSMISVIIAVGIAARIAGKQMAFAGLGLLAASAALFVLYLAMKGIGSLDDKTFFKGFIAIKTFLYQFTLIAVAASLLGKEAALAGLMFMEIGAAMILMAVAVKIMGSMDVKSLAKGLLAINIMKMIITHFMILSFLANGKKVAETGLMIIGVGVAMLAMAVAVKYLGGMSINELEKGVAAVSIFALIISGLIAATKLAGNDVGKSALVLMSTSVVIAVMTLCAILLSYLDLDALAKGVTAMAVLGQVVIGMMLASKNVKQESFKPLLMLTVMIAVVTAAVVGLWFLAKSDPKSLAVAVASVCALLLSMAVAILAIGKNKIDNATIGRLFVFTAIVTILAGIVTGLSFIKFTPDILYAISGIVLLLLGIAVASKITGDISKCKKSSIGAIFTFVGVVGALAATVAALSLLKYTPDILYAIAGVLLLLGGITAAALLTKKLASGSSLKTSVISTIFVFVGVVGALSATVAALSLLKYTPDILYAVSGIILLLEAIALAYVIISKFGGSSSISGSMIGTILAFAGIVSVLAIVMAGLSKLKFTPDILYAVAGISILLMAIAAASVILGYVKGFQPMTLLALLGVVAAFSTIALVVSVLTSQFGPIDLSIETAVAMGILINLLAVACLTLSALGPLATMAVVGALALDAVIIILGALMVGLGALAETIGPFIKNSIPILMDMGTAIGGFIGNLFGGIIEGVGNAIIEFMPKFGMALSEFMMGATVFIVGAKMINGAVLEGIGTLAEAIILLTAAELLSGVTSFLTGGLNFVSFGEQLIAMGTAFNGFAMSISGLSAEDVVKATLAAQALKTIAQVLATIPKTGGIWQDIVGETDFSGFASSIGQFAKMLPNFFMNIENLTEEDLDKVQLAANIIKIFAEAVDTIPNSGGIWQDIVGGKDFSGFAKSIGEFGGMLPNFFENIKDLDSDQLERVKMAAEIISEFADAVSKIPTTGGLWQSLAGGVDFDGFSESVGKFAKMLPNFFMNIQTLDDTKLNLIKKAAEVIPTFGEAFSSIGTDGGLWGTFWGSDKPDYEGFTNGVASFGTAIAEFGNSLVGIDVRGWTRLGTSSSIIKDLATAFSAANADGIGDNIDEFGKALKDLPGYLTDFSEASSDLDYVSAKKFITFLRSTTTINAEKLSKITEFMDSFVSFASSGVQDAGNIVKTAMTTVIDSCLTAMRELKGDFYDVGKLMIAGFKEGLMDTEQVKEAKEAARKAAEVALTTMKNTSEEKSPSKATYRIGKFLDMGLANGMSDYSYLAEKSGEDAADSALSGVDYALSKVQDLINSDIDSAPVIRPIVDTSGVSYGLSRIDGLFANTSSLGFSSNLLGATSTSNLRSISAIDATGQNGAGKNGTLLEAVNELRGDLNTLADKMTKLQVVMDSGVLVGEIVPNIDTALGDIATRKERRV